jgi:hypothetical protein
MSDILVDLVEVGQFAADIHKHPRTIHRWMELSVDPLPYVKLPKQRLIHLPTARTWIMSRMRQQNPRRRQKW